MSSRWSFVPALAGVLLLSACTGGDQEAVAAPSNAVQPAGVASPEDPLDIITDPRSGDFLADGVSTVLHEQGSGPQVFSLARPQHATSIQFYVSCAPDAQFTVTMELFFAGGCAERFVNYGAIPLPDGAAELKVDLDLPTGVAYWIVGVALP